jgi:hypothetical protein
MQDAKKMPARSFDSARPNATGNVRLPLALLRMTELFLRGVTFLARLCLKKLIYPIFLSHSGEIGHIAIPTSSKI